MAALLDVILPVFVLIGLGYGAVRVRILQNAHIDGLMKFVQNLGLPILLFHAMSRLDLGQSFDPSLLGAFYFGATSGFLAGLLGARFLFGRNWEDAVVIGFCCLFSNSLLLGLSITERAYGPDALSANYAIIALHSPFCYLLGITAMEIARARGTAARALPRRVLSAMFRNALVMGIALGLAVNLSGIPVPRPVSEAFGMIAGAALPAALVGTGGVLARYRPAGDLKVILYVCAIALLLHPTLTWTLGTAAALPVDGFRSAVVSAAMAPGVNGYVFASLYDRAQRVAASSVLIGTALSVLTAWFWLSILP